MFQSWIHITGTNEFSVAFDTLVSSAGFRIDFFFCGFLFGIQVKKPQNAASYLELYVVKWLLKIYFFSC